MVIDKSLPAFFDPTTSNRRSTKRALAALDAYRRQQEKYKIKIKALEYKFGDRIGSYGFRLEDINKMHQFRFAVVGPTGAGKSSFIRSTEIAYDCEPSVPIACPLSGGDSTILLKHYIPKYRFSQMLDLRGLSLCSTSEFDEIKTVVRGQMHVGSLMRGHCNPILSLPQQLNSNLKTKSTAGNNINSVIDINDMVHAVLIVFRATDPKLSTYKSSFLPFARWLKARGMTPLTIITHLDELETKSFNLQETLSLSLPLPNISLQSSLQQQQQQQVSQSAYLTKTTLEERENENRLSTLKEVCAHLCASITGSPLDKVFFVSNHSISNNINPKNNSNNKVTDFEIFQIISAAQMSAEQFCQHYWQQHEQLRLLHRYSTYDPPGYSDPSIPSLHFTSSNLSTSSCSSSSSCSVATSQENSTLFENGDLSDDGEDTQTSVEGSTQRIDKSIIADVEDINI